MCLSWLVFFLSFAVPQFKLVSHKSSLQLPSGHSGLVHTLSNAARSFRSTPTCWWQMQASGVLFCWELLLGTQSVGFIYFYSQLSCPLRLENFPQTRQCEGFLVFGNFLY